MRKKLSLPETKKNTMTTVSNELAKVVLAVVVIKYLFELFQIIEEIGFRVMRSLSGCVSRLCVCSPPLT